MSQVTLMGRVGAIARKEFLQVRRDPVLMRLILLLPLFMLIMFGYALSNTVKDIPLAVHDQSHDRISQAILTSFESEHRFKVLPVASSQAAREAVRSGEAKGALEIGPDALKLARAEEAIPLKLSVDGSDPGVSAQIRAGAMASVQDVMGQLIAGRSLVNPGLAAPVDVTMETLYNPDNRTAVYMVPGLVGLILTFVTILLTAIAIVRERETGTMEALIATPVRPIEVVLGKIAPYLGLGVLNAGIILGVGVWLFKVPFVGNFWVFALGLLLFLVGSLGIGIVISTLAQNQLQAMFGTMAYLFPSIFLSGLLFPLEGLNAFFGALSYAVPLRYFLKVARGVMLRGAGLEHLWTELTALSVFAACLLVIASLRFRKSL
ncbi:MAG TPA: ABC transporter permease [Stenomitos sp.]